MDDQYHAFPDLTPPQSAPELPVILPGDEPPPPDRSTIHPHQPGVTADDAISGVLLVPSRLVVSSRYRSILPYAPSSRRVRRVLTVIARESYPPLPARWIDGHFEVFGHELLLDALQAAGTDPIRVRPVAVETEEEALVTGRSARDVHTPRPRPYELIREVWQVRRLEGCTTWQRVGDLLGYQRSTITHAARDGERITPAVVERAGINENDPRHVSQLRRLTGMRLRWVAKGATDEDVAIRLALVCFGAVPEWATPEQIEANGNEPTAERIRERRSRDGKVVAVAELSITGATKEELEQAIKDYRKMVMRMFRELNQDSEQTDVD